MKLIFSVFGALTLMGSIAFADCYTNSRGYRFSGPDENSVTRACRAHPSTSNSECDDRVTCDYNGGGGGHGGSCYTHSRGYEFSGYDASSVASDCRRHPSTSNSECDRNVVCGGIGPGPGYPPPPPPYYPPQPPPPPPVNHGRCYLDRYPDICVNSPKSYCKDPAAHYRNHGRAEGRIWGCQ